VSLTPRHRRAAVIVTGSLLVLSLVLLLGVKGARPPARGVAFSEFLTAIDAGTLKKIEIEPDRFVATQADGGQVQTAAPLGYAAAHQNFVPDLVAHGIRVEVKAGGSTTMFSASALVVTLAFFGLLGFALYRMSPGRLPSIEQDARRAVKDGMSVTFADVAGVDEAKDEVKEIVDFLREPGRFGAIGGRIPKGVLLVGPPGTGKTLLARSIAG
jgi:cell division protease FtsH